jgi:hypothetical protein
VLFLFTTTRQEWGTEHVFLAVSALLEGADAVNGVRDGGSSFLGPKANVGLGRQARYLISLSQATRKLLIKKT